VTLVLKRASASRPSGEWNDDDFDVLADGGPFAYAEEYLVVVKFVCLAASSRTPPPIRAMNSCRFMLSMGTSSPMRYQCRRPARALGFPAPSACHREAG
jgi:hypothetical protein